MLRPVSSQKRTGPPARQRCLRWSRIRFECDWVGASPGVDPFGHRRKLVPLPQTLCTPFFLRPLAAGRLTTLDLPLPTPLPTEEVNIVCDSNGVGAALTQSRSHGVGVATREAHIEKSPKAAARSTPAARATMVR